jgi:rootletin
LFLIDKKGVDTRLQSAQNALLLQEDTIRRGERERKTMLDQITALERQLLGLDTDKKQILVRILIISLKKKKTLFFILIGKNEFSKIE